MSFWSHFNSENNLLNASFALVCAMAPCLPNNVPCQLELPTKARCTEQRELGHVGSRRIGIVVQLTDDYKAQVGPNGRRQACIGHGPEVFKSTKPWLVVGHRRPAPLVPLAVEGQVRVESKAVFGFPVE